MNAGASRGRWRAGPDRSAVPNLPELPIWLGSLLFGALVTLVCTWTVPAVGLPFLPVPVVLAALVLGGISQPRAQRALSGGSLDRRAEWRVALAMACFAVVAYGCGLPSMIPMFAVIVAAVHLHWSGWRIWRYAAVQGLLYTVIGVVLIWRGWLPSAMDPGREITVAAVFLVAGTQTLSILGMTSRRREQMQAELRRTESRFRALVHKSQDIVGILDRDSTILYVSPSAARITARPLNELLGSRLLALVPPAAAAALDAAMIRTEGAGPGETEEIEVFIGAGTEQARWVEVAVTNQLDDPAVAGFVLNAADVTDRRRYREQLVYAATHDQLTGLLNRSAFVTALQRELASVSPTHQAWLFFCDLDGFKGINDRLGHDAGDAVLVHAATQLRRQAGPRSIVGRFGGDEFCVLVPHSPDRTVEPYELRDLLAEAVAEPCRTPGGEHVRVQGSLGLVCLDGRQLLADDVLREADQRMYARKRRAAGRLG